MLSLVLLLCASKHLSIPWLKIFSNEKNLFVFLSLRVLLFPSFSRWESLNSEGLCGPCPTNRVGTKVYAKAQRHERGSVGREQVVSVTALSVMTGSSDFNLEDLIHSLREKLIKCGTQSWVPSFHSQVQMRNLDSGRTVWEREAEIQRKLARTLSALWWRTFGFLVWYLVWTLTGLGSRPETDIEVIREPESSGFLPRFLPHSVATLAAWEGTWDCPWVAWASQPSVSLKACWNLMKLDEDSRRPPEERGQ